LCPKLYKHPKTTKLNLNTTIEEDDGVLPRRPFLLFLRHREEGDGSLLSLPFLFQQHQRRIRQCIVVVFFFSNTKKEGNENKLSLPSSLEHHQRRRRWQQAAIAFFTKTTPQKKTMAHCHCLLLLCNTTIKEDDNTLLSSSFFQTQRRQNTQENNPKKPREGRELTFKLSLCLFTLAPVFTLLFQMLFHGIFF